MQKFHFWTSLNDKVKIASVHLARNSAKITKRIFIMHLQRLHVIASCITQSKQNNFFIVADSCDALIISCLSQEGHIFSLPNYYSKCNHLPVKSRRKWWKPVVLLYLLRWWHNFHSDRFKYLCGPKMHGIANCDNRNLQNNVVLSWTIWYNRIRKLLVEKVM